MRNSSSDLPSDRGAGISVASGIDHYVNLRADLKFYFDGTPILPGAAEPGSWGRVKALYR